MIGERTVIGERTPTEGLRLMRGAFLALATAGVVGTAAELAMLRHWDNAVEAIPWATLALLAAGIALVAFRPTSRAVRIVRWLAFIAALCAVFGAARHVVANYDSGLLDFRYAESWASMSLVSRWWAALTQSVGPAPTLAPMILAQAAACLWGATLGRAGVAVDAHREFPCLAEGQPRDGAEHVVVALASQMPTAGSKGT